MGGMAGRAAGLSRCVRFSLEVAFWQAEGSAHEYMTPVEPLGQEVKASR